MRALLKHPLFLLGLGIKFVCLFLFATKFPTEYFIPFMDHSVTHLGLNPWSFDRPELFPYGSVLWLILFIPKIIFYFIFGDAALGSGALSLFCLKLPLLMADFGLLCLLTKFVQNRTLVLLFLYWLNPIVFYVNYVHGQLDIVSMVFLFLSLWMLFQKRNLWAGILLGLGTGCKFHLVLVLPMILLYLWNNEFRPQSFRKMGAIFATWLVTVLIVFLPLFLANKASHASIGSPEIERLFQARIDLGSGTAVYLSILALLLVYGRLLISTRIMEMGLMMGIGLIFGVVLFTSHPPAGWYVWFIPFLALFFTVYFNINKILFWSLNFLFITVYAIQDFILIKIAEPVFLNILLTALQTALFANLVAIWVLCMKEESPFRRRTSPLTLGLSGDSGSGKDFVTDLIVKIFGSKNVTLIHGDNYHKWERNHFNWKEFTHLNPQANHLFTQSQHVNAMKGGRAVLSKTYDHGTGQFTDPVEVKPTKNLIVQGLHTLFLRENREAFDLRIFLAPDHLLRTAWKVKRDCLERGYSKEKVLSQLQARSDDSQKYIESQINHADLIIEFFPQQTFSQTEAENGLIPEVALRVRAWNSFNFSELATQLQLLGLHSEVINDEKQSDRVSLVLKTKPSRQNIEQMAANLFTSLRHITRSAQPPLFEEGYHGFLQILILWLIQHRIFYSERKGML